MIFKIEGPMFRALLAAMFIIPTVAFAQMPPKKYDHPFDGKLVEHVVKYGEAWKKCQQLDPSRTSPKMKAGRHLYGCSIGGKLDGSKTCTIVYSYDPSGRDPKMKDNVFRHERAHCSGWVH